MRLEKNQGQIKRGPINATAANRWESPVLILRAILFKK